ncbi:MAG: HAD-IA family hydrolase [Thermoplasmata archaeon]|nr:HAD-IA family hydrolase [Thermoplasmata archaeon]
MTEELDAVLFDLGGTLIDTKVPREHVFEEALRSQGVEVERGMLQRAIAEAEHELDGRFAGVDETNEKDYWRELDATVLRKLGLDIDLDLFAADLSSRFGKLISDEENWVPFPETREVLAGLRGRDIKLGLISNATDLARRVMSRLDLEGYFDFVVISEEVGARKPSKEIFDIALKRAGTRPSRALYIGDKLSVDIMGATQAGMSAILVDRNDTYPDAQCLRVRDLNFLRRFF